MYRIIALIVLGVLTGVNGAFAQDNLKALYEKAKKEGEVVLAAGSPPVALKAQIEGFNKRFPGIKVNHIPSTGADATTKILVETRVGQSTYEVAQATSATGERVLSADLVSSFPYHEFGIAKENVRFDQRFPPWFDLFLCARVQHQAGFQGRGAQGLGRTVGPEVEGPEDHLGGERVPVRRPDAGVGNREGAGLRPQVQGAEPPSSSPGADPRLSRPWWRDRRRWR